MALPHLCLQFSLLLFRVWKYPALSYHKMSLSEEVGPIIMKLGQTKCTSQSVFAQNFQLCVWHYSLGLKMNFFVFCLPAVKNDLPLRWIWNFVPPLSYCAVEFPLYEIYFYLDALKISIQVHNLLSVTISHLSWHFEI